MRCTFYFNILFQLWKLNLLPGKHFGSSIFLCHTKYILQIPPNFAHFSQTPELRWYIFWRQDISFPNWFNKYICRQTLIWSVSLFLAKQAVIFIPQQQNWNKSKLLKTSKARKHAPTKLAPCFKRNKFALLHATLIAGRTKTPLKAWKRETTWSS